VFDGRMRYDLSLEFKRGGGGAGGPSETIKVDGYKGRPWLHAGLFSELAGYDPNRAAASRTPHK